MSRSMRTRHFVVTKHEGQDLAPTVRVMHVIALQRRYP